jgi:hypothetical protein
LDAPMTVGHERHAPNDESIRSETSDFFLSDALDSRVPSDVAVDVMGSSGVGSGPRYAPVARALGPNVLDGDHPVDTSDH